MKRKEGKKEGRENNGKEEKKVVLETLFAVSRCSKITSTFHTNHKIEFRNSSTLRSLHPVLVGITRYCPALSERPSV